jgi:hypothetical protein
MKLVWSGRSDLDGFEVAFTLRWGEDADGHTRVALDLLNRFGRVKLLRGFGYTGTARALAQLVADHG